jgi:TonB-dependent receptor
MLAANVSINWDFPSNKEVKMSKNKTMQKTKLATAISTVLCMAASPAVVAQDDIEEVVVTGIRGSLQAALDVKRESSGVMDAISNEDIGKFPDTNLAESLQRITGVSINRVEGEGSEATIRGFSGSFNMVTLNGRQMPSADARPQFFGINANVNSADERSFDFSNLASEGVSGLQVYKSGKAGVPSGGIGGTINIETISPLDTGNVATFGVKAVSDGGAHDGITPEISGLGSWVNDSGTFGVAAFGSYQDRNYTNRTALQGNIVWQNPFDATIPAFAGATIVNPPPADRLTGFPRSATLVYSEAQRERVNGMLTLQFAPNDQLTITADAMFAQNDQSSKAVSDLPYFVRQFDFVAFDDDPVVSLPLFIGEPLVSGGGSDFTQAGKELPHRNSLFKVRDTLQSVGFNVDYVVNDSLTVNADIATSKAIAGGNFPAGSITEGVSIGGQAVAAQFIDYRSEIPLTVQTIADGSGATSSNVNGTVVNFAGGNSNGVWEKSDLGSQYTLRNYSDQESTINQAHLNASWDNGGAFRANFGMSYVDYDMAHYSSGQRDELGGWNTGFIGDIPTLMGNDAIETICITCKFRDDDNRILPLDTIIADYTAAGGTVAAGSKPRRTGDVSFYVDPIAMAKAFDGFTNGGGKVFDEGNRNVNSEDDNHISEDSLSIFAEFIAEGEINDMPVEVVVGLRHESTEVLSSSLQNIPVEKNWTSDNDFGTVMGATVSSVEQDFSYNNILPSLDVSLDLSENLKGRVSFSKTLARPSLSSMFLKVNAGSPDTATYLGGKASGSRGNAALLPLLSNNFDLSLEYYYGEGSAVTVAYFNKSIANFIGNEQVTDNLFGLRDVASGNAGTRSGAAVAALLAGGWLVTETNMFSMTAILDNPTVYPTGAAAFIDPSQTGGSALSSDLATVYDISPNAADPLLDFIIQQPTNAATAGIEGWELNWVHFFTGAFTGFGLQANATFVSGDIGFDNYADPSAADQFAQTGLSDSANLILFYENDKYAARVLYNQRGEFLSNTNIGDRVPRFVDAYSQLDINASYAATDNLTLTLEGINMLEEPVVFRGRTETQVQSFVEGDMRVMFGARYNF